ncbi:acyl-CoA thioesterase [Zhihengliuella flava]|uniref:Acyl-CoA thioester hydrolase n=1 Tax=Zhihengliuella flava TaxID=1285193 RepID=A0A931D654_9MICC|nr:thioesterase family protein [Zhihengliuella flava]MBG6085139.1 acyl-CoA thioester hydrolase [Zhihengliuella flava]
MSFTDITLQLRWSDQDANGHLNNARVVTLMEESRVRFIRAVPALETFRGGGGAVVANLTVDYLAQGHYTPEITVRVGVERIGTKSFTVRHVGVQEVRGTSVTVFDGATVVVPLGEDGRSARALLDTERQALAVFGVEPRPGR